MRPTLTALVRVVAIVSLASGSLGGVWAHARCIEEPHTCQVTAPVMDCCGDQWSSLQSPGTLGDAGTTLPHPSAMPARTHPVALAGAIAGARLTALEHLQLPIDRVILFETFLI